MLPLVDVLIRIKRLAVSHRVEFTWKAELERLRDALTVEDILESILNANAVKKVLRSRSSARSRRREHLYVIESPTYRGTWSTPRVFRKKGGLEVYYVFVSSKVAT